MTPFGDSAMMADFGADTVALPSPLLLGGVGWEWVSREARRCDWGEADTWKKESELWGLGVAGGVLNISWALSSLPAKGFFCSWPKGEESIVFLGESAMCGGSTAVCILGAWMTWVLGLEITGFWIHSLRNDG